ncbi:unnamed protein product, partial [Laminaria digitata]
MLTLPHCMSLQQETFWPSSFWAGPVRHAPFFLPLLVRPSPLANHCHDRRPTLSPNPSSNFPGNSGKFRENWGPKISIQLQTREDVAHLLQHLQPPSTHPLPPPNFFLIFTPNLA